MCMEDIQLARESGPDVRTVSLAGGTDESVVGFDPHRTRITFSANGAATCWVAPQGITPALNTGFALTVGAPIRTFTVEELGRAITAPWRAFSVGAQVLSVISLTLEREK